VIVASVALTSQTASIGNTTLYTPEEDGDYLATGYLEIPSTSHGDGDAALYFTWQDDIQAESGSGIIAQYPAFGISGHQVIRAKSGYAIQYHVDFLLGANTPWFNVFIKLVRL